MLMPQSEILTAHLEQHMSLALAQRCSKCAVKLYQSCTDLLMPPQAPETGKLTRPSSASTGIKGRGQGKKVFWSQGREGEGHSQSRWASLCHGTCAKSRPFSPGSAEQLQVADLICIFRLQRSEETHWDCSSIIQSKGKIFPCPTVVQKLPQTCAGYSTGNPACMFKRKLGQSFTQ